MKNQTNNPLAFYNAVASGYNEILRADKCNELIRTEVAEYFTKAVSGKVVLDFGGGTGLDLPWLVKNNYEIFFCEPSAEMRKYAIELSDNTLKNGRIRFLNDMETDFMNWAPNTFGQKLDAVLANFAVLNSIQNISALFERLAEIIKPQGHVIANLIDTTPLGIMKYRKLNFLKALIKGEKPLLLTQYKQYEHVSFLHTPLKIKEATPQFICRAIHPLNGFGFMLVHLQHR